MEEKISPKEFSIHVPRAMSVNIFLYKKFHKLYHFMIIDFPSH